MIFIVARPPDAHITHSICHSQGIGKNDIKFPVDQTPLYSPEKKSEHARPVCMRDGGRRGVGGWLGCGVGGGEVW